MQDAHQAALVPWAVQQAALVPCWAVQLVGSSLLVGRLPCAMPEATFWL